MALLQPFYSEPKKEEIPTWIPTSYEEKAMKEDLEDIQQMSDYRMKFIPQMTRSARVLNLIADPVSDDRVSNVFIGISRMLIDTAISAMTDGKPRFNFIPGSAKDYPKIDLWRSAIDGALMESNFSEHQNNFFLNYIGLGTGAYEAYIQSPMRTIRSKSDSGEWTEKVVRDHRPGRPKIGVRSRSPHEILINPNARTTMEIPSCAHQDNYSYDQFVQNFARCVLSDGKKKYMNCEHVSPGKTVDFGINGKLRYRINERSAVEVITYQNEIRDIYRIYANGVLICDKSLRINKDDKNNSGGANVLGLSTLCIGTNNYQFDQNMQTQSLYGMSDAHLVRGLDALYQAFFNMTVDNWKLANSVAISYKPYGNSMLDLDNVDFYSGTLIDGEVVTSPLGRVNLAEYNELRQGIEDLCIWLTGTNYKQLVGETSKTAFELSQRIRAQNKRFESKIRQMESGCLKKMGRILLANVMSELTVEDYEAVTDYQIEDIRDAVKSGTAPAEDYKWEGDKPVERKNRTMIRVPGKSYIETFSKNKKRKLDSESVDNTLMLDRTGQGRDSYVPAVGEYLWSQEYMERGGVPDVYVEGDTMISDKRSMVSAEIAEFLPIALQIKQMEVQMHDDSFQTNVDFGKLVEEFAHSKNLPESVLTKKPKMKDHVMRAKGILDQMKAMTFSTPIQNAPPSGTPVQSSPAEPLPPSTPSNVGASSFNPAAGGSAS